MARSPRKAPVDLEELDAAVTKQEEGIVVPLLQLDGRSPLGFGIRVAGPDSEKARMARTRAQQELIARGSFDPLTPEETFARGSVYLSRITIAFDGRAVLGGRELENTEEDFLKLYRRFGFIRDQVNAVAGMRELFMPGQSESSGTEPSQQSDT